MSFIYNELHNVTVHTKPNEEKECSFRITVELENSLQGKAFDIKITDDSDPTFLNSLVLNEQDFSALKAQQGLRVDFDNFPKQLSKLLSNCKSSEKQFQLILDDVDIDDSTFKTRTGCHLKVIESNDFKYLCHLSLRIAPGSEEDVRRHLCSKLNLAQDQLSHEREKVRRLQTQNEEYAADLLQKDRKITELEFRLADETNSLRLELSQQVALEMEKHGNERKEMEAQHHRVVQELHSDLKLLRHNKLSLIEAKQDLESRLNEMAQKNETMKNELSRLSVENADLEETLSTQKQITARLESNLSETQRRLAVSERERQGLSSRLTVEHRELQTAQQRERALATDLSKCERHLQHTADQLEIALNEITTLKANLAEKEKKKTNMIRVGKILEEKLESISKELSAKSEQFLLLEEKMTQTTKELESATKKIETMEEKIKEQENTIKKQTDVNICLHRKLNEKDALGRSLNSSAPAPITNPRLTSSLTIGSKTLPPWLHSASSTNLGTGRSSTAGGGMGDSNRKPALDPFYLMPAENDNAANKSGRVKSAYFPLKHNP